MFEIDPEKSAANLAQHGIDFESAQELWLDLKRVQIPARSEAEVRFAIVGMIDGKISAAFATQRGDTIRIISVRRARTSEVNYYEAEDRKP